MSVASVLRAAADLLEPPGAWAQATAARNPEGKPVGRDSPDAVCFCLEAAIRNLGPRESWRTISRFVQRFTDMPIFQWNDAPERTQSEVVAMARSLARQAEKEGI